MNSHNENYLKNHLKQLEIRKEILAVCSVKLRCIPNPDTTSGSPGLKIPEFRTHVYDIKWPAVCVESMHSLLSSLDYFNLTQSQC